MAVELLTAVMATPLQVIAETLRTEVLVSSVARPTMRMRSVPVPTVCVQLVEAPLVAALEATLSNVMAAEAETAAKAVQINEAASARALRPRKRGSFTSFICCLGISARAGVHALKG